MIDLVVARGEVGMHMHVNQAREQRVFTKIQQGGIFGNAPIRYNRENSVALYNDNRAWNCSTGPVDKCFGCDGGLLRGRDEGKKVYCQKKYMAHTLST